jgi:hypothetical protein
MKIRPVRVELLHADRRTDLTKLIVVLRNSAIAPKNLQFHIIITGRVTEQM